jgi:hypothetical protein
MTADENMENSEPVDDFERMFAEMNTPEAKLKFERKHQSSARSSTLASRISTQASTPRWSGTSLRGSS